MIPKSMPRITSGVRTGFRTRSCANRSWGPNAAIIADPTNQVPDAVRRQDMFARLIATLVKVAVASLIVGTILAHFGITADQILKDFGITPERLAEMARQGFAWALPNLLLGSLIIVPVWLVIFLFRPPGARSE